MRVDEIKNEIDHLTVSEKLILIENVWDDFARSNHQLPLSEWQKQELSKRGALYENGNLITKSKAEVHENLREKYS